MPRKKYYPKFKHRSVVREFVNLRDDPDWRFYRGKAPTKWEYTDRDSISMTAHHKYNFSKHTSWKKNRKAQYR